MGNLWLCYDNATGMPRLPGNGNATDLPRASRVYVMGMSTWVCHGKPKGPLRSIYEDAVGVLWVCYGYAVGVPWVCCGSAICPPNSAMHLPWVCHWHAVPPLRVGHDAAMGMTKMVCGGPAEILCHGSAMGMPWVCHKSAMHLQLIGCRGHPDGMPLVYAAGPP